MSYHGVVYSTPKYRQVEFFELCFFFVFFNLSPEMGRIMALPIIGNKYWCS